MVISRKSESVTIPASIPPTEMVHSYWYLNGVRCFDSIWLPQFPTSCASLNTVESHCLLYIPTVIRVSRTLENIMGECFANEIVQWCGKGYEIEVTKMGQNCTLFLQCNCNYFLVHRFPNTVTVAWEECWHSSLIPEPCILASSLWCCKWSKR